jgi:hypothetical protein
MIYINNTAHLGFVYRWTDSNNGMYYVGSHKGTVDDGYVGSGKRFKFAYKKRPEAFEREILYTGEHYQEVEDLILKTLDVENDDKSYNLKEIGWGGSKKGIKRTEETKRKMSDSRIGIKFSDSHRANLSKSLIGNNRCRKQPILDITTGIVYPTIKDCCIALNLNNKSVNNAFWRYRKGIDKTKAPSIKNLKYVS